MPWLSAPKSKRRGTEQAIRARQRHGNTEILTEIPGVCVPLCLWRPPFLHSTRTRRFQPSVSPCRGSKQPTLPEEHALPPSRAGYPTLRKERVTGAPAQRQQGTANAGGSYKRQGRRAAHSPARRTLTGAVRIKRRGWIAAIPPGKRRLYGLPAASNFSVSCSGSRVKVLRWKGVMP